MGGHSCQAGHAGVVISGRLSGSHDDVSKIGIGPGDAYYFVSGHDGWVIYEFAETGKTSTLGLKLINKL